MMDPSAEVYHWTGDGAGRNGSGVVNDRSRRGGQGGTLHGREEEHAHRNRPRHASHLALLLLAPPVHERIRPGEENPSLTSGDGGRRSGGLLCGAERDSPGWHTVHGSGQFVGGNPNPEADPPPVQCNELEAIQREVFFGPDSGPGAIGGRSPRDGPHRRSSTPRSSLPEA